MITKRRKLSRLPSLRARPFAALLPIMPRVVFVDWHGVLSHDIFWSSIMQNKAHPYSEILREAREKLFGRRSDLVRAWMRGEMQSSEIVKLLDVTLDKRYGADYLMRKLYDDCRRMEIQDEIASALHIIRKRSFVILATDNMDCFFDQIDKKFDLRALLDGVLCSSVIGVLKSESVKLFFEPWLIHHKLSFSQALLLDDSATICNAFRRAGGTAEVVQSPAQAIEALQAWDRLSGSC